jgi:hypothetical protein
LDGNTIYLVGLADVFAGTVEEVNADIVVDPVVGGGRSSYRLQLILNR